MTRTSTAMDRLRAADPLADAMAANAAPPRRRRAPRLAMSGVAVTAVAALAFVLLPGGAAQPSDARAVDSLLAAGRAAAAAVDTPLKPGQLIYSRTEHLYSTTVYLSGGVHAVYRDGVATDESWIAMNGAMTRVEVPSGPRTYPTPRDKMILRGLHVPVDVRHVDRIPASAGSVNAPTYDFARTLPTDPTALGQRIRQDTAGAGESADAEVWVTVRDMLISPVSSPALRAALYQVAAGLPGVEYLGMTKDRLGRSGVEVALSHGDDTHARTREVMIFDPATGLLLESAQIALDPAQYGLPAGMKGAVVEWEVWVQSAVVDGIGVRPDGTHANLR